MHFEGEEAKQLKRVVILAGKLNLMDESTVEIIQQNAEVMLRDPKRAGEQLGEEYQEIAEDSKKFIM